MFTVNPTEETVATFAGQMVDETAIAMVNLLRFREIADYGEDDRTPRVSGRAAYARYSKAVTPLLWEVGGQPLYRGHARAMFIAPREETWDEAILVHYPSRRAFLRMVNSRAYRGIMHHRTAALLDSRLIETTSDLPPRAVLGVARALTRAATLFFPKIPR